MMEFVKLWLKIMRFIALTIVVGAAISYPAVLLLTKAEETGSTIYYIGAFVYFLIVVGLGTAIMVWNTEERVPGTRNYNRDYRWMKCNE